MSFLPVDRRGIINQQISLKSNFNSKFAFSCRLACLGSQFCIGCSVSFECVLVFYFYFENSMKAWNIKIKHIRILENQLLVTFKI
ncbi:hypothetical protein T4B_2810 [Trichinella pseudospiralis]|uniref:Uncharacterized protein n=1 Tax=Trichinella pseudospiralis TaxID=6337 RepID=A0A0V1IJM0_TRIPS|nr:hypothetical protein T4B_2810 [Trichinella pseudospiralis]